MRALVTGGAGFIGSHLVETLVARGDEVVVFDDLRGGTLGNLEAVADRIRFEEGDILEADLPSLVAGFDLVFHLAGTAYVPPSVEDPIYDFRLTAEATLKVLDAVRRSGGDARVVYTSSAAVYGDPAVQPIHEDLPAAPISPYGLHKFTAEREVALFASLYGMRTASARLFSVYGPRQRKQVVFDLATKMLADPDRIQAHGDGTQVRDFVFVSDVVAALCAIAERAPMRGEVYNVASGSGITTADLVRLVAAALGLEPEVVWSGSVRPGDPEKWLADVSRLRMLGWGPGTGIAEGIASTVAWAKEVVEA